MAGPTYGATGDPAHNVGSRLTNRILPPGYDIPGYDKGRSATPVSPDLPCPEVQLTDFLGM